MYYKKVPLETSQEATKEIPASHPLLMEAKERIKARRRAEGLDRVTQADVDLVAELHVDLDVRPHARSIAKFTGGSLGTVAPMFDDWWRRFAARARRTKRWQDLPTRVAVRLSHLVMELEAAVREHIQPGPDPAKALLLAAQFGTTRALRERVAALEAERDARQAAVAGLTAETARLAAALDQRMEEMSVQSGQEHRQLSQALSMLSSLSARLTSSSIPESTLARQLVDKMAELEKLMRRNVRPPARKKMSRRTPARRAPRPRAIDKRTARIKMRRIASSDRSARTHGTPRLKPSRRPAR